MNSMPCLLQLPDEIVPSGLTFYPRHSKYSPYQLTQPLQDPVVLIHGWGADSQIWRDLPNQLSQYTDVYTLDLPGFGASVPLDEYSEQSLINWLDQRLPNSCYLVGLSLGGMLCRAYGAQNPQKVRGLVTLSSNLRFVANKQYPQAMSGLDFEHFSKTWRQDPDACLRRFKSLQAQGDQHQRQLMTELRNLESKVDIAGASELLNLLATLDGREHIQHIKCPSLAIFGAEDRLVPAVAATALPPSHSKAIIPNSGHLPHLSDSSVVMNKLKDFFGLQRANSHKRQLAKCFSAAAATYDAEAEVQNWSGQQLISRIHSQNTIDSIIDLGCGTGVHCAQLKGLYPHASVLGIDLAPGMLDYSRCQFSDRVLNWLCCDIESLSLSDDSHSLVFSNFALQWCDSLQDTVAEIFRVLKTAGRFYFAVPGPRTLHELRAAWSQIDSEPRINEFFSIDLWQESLLSCGFTSVSLERIEKMQYFTSVKDLMRNIQAVGANVKKTGISRYTGKSQFKQLHSEYEKYRTPQGLVPATWDIIFGAVVK